MKALTAALLVFVAACGEGRAVLNVDVLSFLSASDSTTPYNVPGGVPPVDSTVSQMFTLPPRFGKSNVDSISATAAASLQNTAGGGSVQFDVFFAKAQAGLFTGTPYLSANSGAVSGVQTVPLVPPTTVSLADTVFAADTVWVGIRARISTNAGPNMQGQLRLTDLRVRIVVQDNIF